MAAAPWLVLAARVVLLRRDPVLWGDPATLDLQALDAVRGDTALGPYSRYGFRHPGPAMSYAVSPVVALSGRATWALPAGLLLVGALAAATTVGVVARRVGPVAGWLAAAVLGAQLVAVGLDVLQVPWNPLVIVGVVATLLVVAALARGLGPGLAGVGLAGTFLVQTHVGTAVLVAAVGAVALAGAWWDRPAEGSRRARPAAAGLVVVTALAWVPPVVQQLTTEPGNLGELLSFFLRGDYERTTTALDAAAHLGRELDWLRGPPHLGSLRPDDPGRARSLVVLGLVVAAVAGLVGGARRWGCRPALRLGAVAGVGLVASWLALLRVAGEVYWYLALWASSLLVPVLLGWALLAWDRLGRPADGVDDRRGRAGWVPVAAAVVLGAAALVAPLGRPVYDSPAFPDDAAAREQVRTARELVAAAVDAGGGSGPVAFTAPYPDVWPLVAGVAVDLERRGAGWRVHAELATPFEPGHGADGCEPLTVMVLPAGVPAGEGAAPLGRAGAYDLWRVAPPVPCGSAGPG